MINLMDAILVVGETFTFGEDTMAKKTAAPAKRGTSTKTKHSRSAEDEEDEDEPTVTKRGAKATTDEDDDEDVGFGEEDDADFDEDDGDEIEESEDEADDDEDDADEDDDELDEDEADDDGEAEDDEDDEDELDADESEDEDEDDEDFELAEEKPVSAKKPKGRKAAGTKAAPAPSAAHDDQHLAMLAKIIELLEGINEAIKAVAKAPVAAKPTASVDEKPTARASKAAAEKPLSYVRKRKTALFEEGNKVRFKDNDDKYHPGVVVKVGTKLLTVKDQGGKEHQIDPAKRSVKRGVNPGA